MFVIQTRRLALKKYDNTGTLYFLNQKRLKFVSQPDPEEENVEKKPLKKLKQWRPEFDVKTKLQTKLKIFERDTGRPSTDFIVMMNAPWDISRSGITKWWGRKKREMEIYDQRFIKERHEVLGSNLAAAHFLVFRGARVKFCGREGWVEKNSKDEYDLPGKYEPDYQLEAIDLKGINLHYEGLLNLRYLFDLRYFSLKGSKTIDDWCLDRISGQFARVEHLDVSDCPNVSERGLEALYRMQSLKTLVVTNHLRSPAFDLTCMMLEDCNPNLRIDVITPEPEPVAVKS